MQPNLTGSRVLFVSAASSDVGFGHLSRCLSLASYAQLCGADIEFLVFGDLDAKERIIAADFSCILIETAATSSAKWPQTFGLKADVVIVDLLYPGFLASVTPSIFFRSVRNLGRLIVLIDVLGENSIKSQLSMLSLDIVVCPYVTSDLGIQITSGRYLESANYALLAPEYANLPVRYLRKNANRVLVSCGGSDPLGYTSEILCGLDNVSKFLEVRVVVGPMFSTVLKSEVTKLAAKSRHQVAVVSSPTRLLNEMLWCDLAICSNGLTKYELAASQTPALLFSIDAHHESVNRPFASKQTAIDLGVGISSSRLVQATTELLSNLVWRSSMARKGRELIDGMGTERLFNEINKAIFS
jgi:UDP-2,4-diacetamido-2,4,6-trideoxy-beta-L-altropyranose hydrolase